MPEERKSEKPTALSGVEIQALRCAFAGATAEAVRAIFQTNAASVLSFDEPRGELVFDAVSGEGAAALIGKRIPASTGIAGAVLASGEATVVEDASADPRFARDIAKASGYIPEQLMVAPIVSGGRMLGVLEALDRPQFSRFSLVELDLLCLLADQVAIALVAFESSHAPRQ